MATATAETKEKKKYSIYERSDLSPAPIQHVERLLHTAGREVAEKDLTNLVNKFWSESFDVDEGKLKGMDEQQAVAKFLNTLGEYHYGKKRFDEMKNENPDKVMDELRSVYGHDWKSLRELFSKGFADQNDYYRDIRDPMIESSQRVKRQQASTAIDAYTSDAELRNQLKAHLQKRVGKRPLHKTKLEILNPDYVGQVMQTYLSVPGALESIEKAPKTASIDIPTELAGNPRVHHIFEQGKVYRAARDQLLINADHSHTLNPEYAKKRKAPQYQN